MDESGAGVGAGGGSTAVQSRPWKRWEPLTGIAFVVLFILSTVVSNVPAATAGDRDWVAAYTGGGNQAGHFATGICLVLAGLCLLSFQTMLWTRIAVAHRPLPVSPLPLVAAGVAAACMGAGGVLMGVISASALLGSGPVPSADVLRMANDTGFGMVALAGMMATALSVAGVTVQAHAAGLFGGRLRVLGLVVAVVLLASLAFIPIVALFAWLVVVSIVLMRRPAPA
jgi:hypothetical protein